MTYEIARFGEKAPLNADTTLMYFPHNKKTKQNSSWIQSCILFFFLMTGSQNLILMMYKPRPKSGPARDWPLGQGLPHFWRADKAKERGWRDKSPHDDASAGTQRRRLDFEGPKANEMRRGDVSPRESDVSGGDRQGPCSWTRRQAPEPLS